MDASDIDNLINNYSDFEKSIDDKIQACKKIKDNPDSANTALLIQLIKSQKKSAEMAEKILFLSRFMGVLAGGAFIIAVGTLALVYLVTGPDRTLWGSLIILAAGIGVMILLAIALPRSKKPGTEKK